MENQQSVDVVIITALEKERDAVLRYLNVYETVQIKNHTVYHLPHHHTESAYHVVVSCIGKMGNVEAGIATTLAILNLNPSIIILTGIMGGVEKRNERYLGDLIIPDQIVGYEQGKITDQGTERRDDPLRPDYTLLTKAKNLPLITKPSITRPDGKDKLPQLHFGTVASGEKIVADTQTVPKLQNNWRKLIGIEMESYGAALAVYQAESDIKFLMVKGICDWANPDKNDDWQEYAADVAAAYVVNFLKSKPLDCQSQQTVNQTKPFPETLCYLPDRQGQKDKLKITIADYQKWNTNEKRPLLCLIHGNENEYSNFIEGCLLKDFLRHDIYLSKYFYNPVKFKEIKFSLETTPTIDKLHQQILMRLVEIIGVEPEKEAIAKEFARYNQPIVVYTRINTTHLDGWKEDKKEIIDGFIDFWAQWPKSLTQRHPFLVFLSFIYENEGNKTLSLSGVKNFFRAKKRQATNLMVQDRIQELGEMFVTLKDSLKHKGVYAVVLPQLDSVDWTSLENWTTNYEELIKPYHDIQALQHKLKFFYDDNGKKSIPMNKLVSELKRILINPNQ